MTKLKDTFEKEVIAHKALQKEMEKIKEQVMHVNSLSLPSPS